MGSKEMNNSHDFPDQEIESAWELFSQLSQLTNLLWDHYESSFLDKLRERNLPPSSPDPIELPF